MGTAGLEPTTEVPATEVPATEGPATEGSADSVLHDGVVISPMLRRHLRAVVAIERTANPHPWSHSLFAGELTMPTSRFWVVAREGRHVLGYSGLMVTLDEGHITNFAVHEDHRRRHIGARMLLASCGEAVERGVTDLLLEVRASNAAAQAMYRRFGFAPGGVRRGYYNDNGEDALVMWAHDIDGERERERRSAIESSLPVPLRVEQR